MALLINIVNEKGISSSYHKIIAVSQVYIGEQKNISINIASYTNQEYRLQDEKEMIVSNTGLVLPFDETEDFSRSTLYARIVVEIPEFEGAIEI